MPALNSEPYDLLVVGAGPVGCTVAAKAARDGGWRCLVIDHRPHVAGNCFDYYNPQGLLLHKYGPHYFRTEIPSVKKFLSLYTKWIPGNYIVKSAIAGRLYPFPINLTTLEMFFGRSFTAKSAEAFMAEQRVPIRTPRNSEEFVLSRVGRPMFEAFYRHYTRKQWGRPARQLDPSVCGRIPIRMNRDERYVNEGNQMMPAGGYTAMFSSMMRHPLIDLRLGVNYTDVEKLGKPRVATLYTGPLDSYFQYRYGRLPWRSIRFESRTYNTAFVQPCVQINYPDSRAYTRSVEIKHVTGQQHRKTVITREYPLARGEPYYPIPSEGSKKRFLRYWALAEAETLQKHVYFAGRLAEYQYINTDQAVAKGLAMWDRIRAERGPR